jgi:stage II sporulation SpoD-like protein
MRVDGTHLGHGRDRSAVRFLAHVAALLSLVQALTQPAAAAPIATARVRGEVVESGSGAPIAGATIRLSATGAVTVSRPDGTFEFATPVVTASPYSRIAAEVTSPGWARWSISGAPLYPNDALILHAELGHASFAHHVTTPQERASGVGAGAEAPAAQAGPTGNTCTGWDTQLIPPENIKVYRHESGNSESRDFVFYATHVLPNEWISSWDADALAAGAVAVRTYAAYKAMTGHAYSSGSDCADVRDDTQDQVFDPTWSAGSTDAAVYASYGSILYRDGGLFLSQYYSGASGDPCKKVTGIYAGRMSQWGTQTCATKGKLWPDIVTIFYENTVWTYLQNLLLNPSFSTEPMYPWIAVANTSYARVKGDGYEGAWYLAVTATTSGRNAIVREERQFSGSTTIEYHAKAALRCSDSKDCAISMKVVTIGTNTVTKTKALTVPSDGQWHIYTFDPSAGGKSHDEVYLSFVSLRDFDLDAAVLEAPYGG